MKSEGLAHHRPIVIALKKAGFKVLEVVKQDKKVVIIVNSCETMCSTENKETKL